jgi:predicted Zn-dependent protease
MPSPLSAARAAVLGAVLALLPASALPAPADDLPVLGDASSGIVSPEVEAMLGDDFLRQLRAQLPTRGDPLLHYWTEALLYRLAASSDLKEAQLKLVLIDAAPINAFAAPGGIVGIHFGTYAQAATVHEFSSILAHELAHLSQRHFARGVEAQRQASLPFLAAVLASAALMATVGGDAGLAALASAQAVSQQNQLRYSRSREREADRLGIETMVRADMDPWAASRMFEHMADVNRFSRRLPEFMLTHPVTESRIADARSQASAYPRKAYPLSLPYQLMRARVRLMLAASPQEAEQRFRAELEDGRTQLAAAPRYGLVLALTAQGRHREAETALAPLLEKDPDNVAYTLAAVDLLLAQGRAGEALARLEGALRVSPGVYPLRRAYADALTAADHHSAAQGVLEALARARPQDESIWYALAETAGLAGDIIAVHRARAEYFQLHGAIDNALQHLRYALQLIEDDYPMTARVTQRMADLREMRLRLAG